ncbi:hypothetical protein DFH29DRAFT_1010670 [Suillus ampliporus]|nr:hypothetical protein DFH29DRAFT_1010670 [Suillus ampliporus]
MPSAETSNKALSNAAAQVIQILAGAVKLKEGHPEHLRLAVQMGEIMSPVFATHGISATVVSPILLSAAMEMLEHLDPTRQRFVTAPVWANIRADDPQDPAASIERQGPHYRCIQAGAINIHHRGLKVDARPRPIKAKTQAGIKEEAGRGSSNRQGDEACTLASEKRRQDSSSSEPPAPPVARQSSFENSASPPATISKKQRVTEAPLPPPADGPQEDITDDMDASEVVPHCDQCIKLSIICRQGYGATGAALKACARCSRLKLKCSRSKIDAAPKPKGQPRRQRSSSHRRPPAPDILMDGDAAAPHAPTYSVPPIATLSPDSGSPHPAKPSSSTTLDPPSGSVVPTLQHSMEVDFEGDAMVNDLRAMTLDVMNDNVVLLSKQSGLRDAANGVRAELVKLQARHTATADLVNALSDRIAAQDADIRALHDLHSNIEAVQNQVKVLQEESVARDETLRQAQAQLARQEQATGILQDAYNALRYRVLGHNQLLSPPFPGPMYHANTPYSGNHSMMPVSMGQMQAMEGLYFNLSAGASAIGGPSVGNIAGGSGWNGTGGPSAGRSHNRIAGSSHTGAHTFGESASGRGPQN